MSTQTDEGRALRAECPNCGGTTNPIEYEAAVGKLRMELNTTTNQLQDVRERLRERSRERHSEFCEIPSRRDSWETCQQEPCISDRALTEREEP